MNIATYEDVKNVKEDTLIIDVREKQELIETGVLPKSINIPLGQLETALDKYSGEEFESAYGCPKPTFDHPLIFSCKAGGRAQRAMASATALGYTNVSYYKGSWLDWEEKSKQ